MVTLVIVLVMALLVAVFALKNSSMIVVDLFFTKLEMSQALLILACVVIGIIIMFIIYLVQTVKKSSQIKHLTKELDATKNELESVKAKLALSEGDLRVKTAKTLEQSILDNRVDGFNGNEKLFENNRDSYDSNLDQTKKHDIIRDSDIHNNLNNGDKFE
ncbi:MAG: LapA family protein [Tissierellia bacterium]|nr:LapA family protein [Tissierellia bacterium]